MAHIYRGLDERGIRGGWASLTGNDHPPQGKRSSETRNGAVRGVARTDAACDRLMEPLMARIADPSERPEGARPVLLTTLLVPLPTTGTGD